MARPDAQKSTIVRAHEAQGLRSAFAVLERTAPGLGARLAEELWFRVPGPAPVGVPGPSAPGAGTPFEVSWQGHAVRGRRWGEGPVVYLVHGWGGHAGQLASFVGPLVGAGFSAVAYDGPSHGDSDPGPFGRGKGSVVELGQALDAVFARFGPAHAVVAHSMGAMSSVLALRDGWLGARRLAFVAPLVDAAAVLPVFADRLGLGPRVRRRLTERIRDRIGLPIEEFDLVRLSGQIERPELLVVHDEADRETPHAAARELVGAWPGARLVTTRGLGHRRILRDAGVVRSVVEFVRAGDAEQELSQPA
ncbi:MAG: alpha/beta fold hydrolase [Propionibacteriales bacterium]|nr:alpha/beta fold hydrolase [Propionibacteriales bacterium]